MTKGAYAQAGVDIDAGNQAVELMKNAIRRTYTPQVLSDTGNFGGLFSIEHLKHMTAPILVASTDGVGTKTKVATRLNRWDTIGQDLVNHCINDILVQGATPLFFMDYVASSKLVPQHIATIVKGIAQACEQAGIALLGGETAEMPDVYVSGEIDLAGTIVGVVDRAHLIDGKQIQVGDVVLNLASSGLHTNGFSLARKVLDGLDWQTPHSDLQTTIGEVLLAVHRPYLHEIQAIRNAHISIKGLAHITGGGVIENLPRILPHGLGANITLGAWDVLPIFGLLQRTGDIPTAEMYRVFNMSLGMLMVLSPQDIAQAQAILPELRVVGEIITGAGVTLWGESA
jgi:phosphoribosylformylglycinamidine cyclo-ligase